MPKLVLVLWLLVGAHGLDLVDLVEPPASKAQSRGGLVSRTPPEVAEVVGLLFFRELALRVAVCGVRMLLSTGCRVAEGGVRSG